MYQNSLTRINMTFNYQPIRPDESYFMKLKVYKMIMVKISSVVVPDTSVVVLVLIFSYRRA